MANSGAELKQGDNAALKSCVIAQYVIDARPVSMGGMDRATSYLCIHIRPAQNNFPKACQILDLNAYRATENQQPQVYIDSNKKVQTPQKRCRSKGAAPGGLSTLVRRLFGSR